MRQRRNAEDWRRVVFRARYVERNAGERVRIKWETTTILLYLADFMTIERKVSRGRHLVARDLGISPRTVDRAIAEAHHVGFLSTVQRGQKGITAVYQGLFPKVMNDRSERHLVGAQTTPKVVALNTPSARQLVGAPIDTTAEHFAACEPCGGSGCSMCDGWPA